MHGNNAKQPIEKSIEIYDAKIQFVSLVDRPANRRSFLVAKCKGKTNAKNFDVLANVLKAEDATHYVTAVAYEPMTTDTDDNYMTEHEIQRMAHWFMKHGRMVDEQHSFEANANCQIVES